MLFFIFKINSSEFTNMPDGEYLLNSYNPKKNLTVDDDGLKIEDSPHLNKANQIKIIGNDDLTHKIQFIENEEYLCKSRLAIKGITTCKKFIKSRSSWMFKRIDKSVYKIMNNGKCLEVNNTLVLNMKLRSDIFLNECNEKNFNQWWSVAPLNSSQRFSSFKERFSKYIDSFTS